MDKNEIIKLSKTYGAPWNFTSLKNGKYVALWGSGRANKEECERQMNQCNEKLERAERPERFVMGEHKTVRSNELEWGFGIDEEQDKVIYQLLD